MSEQQPPVVYPYSCKIEADQKCVKISTHSYGSNPGITVIDAVDMFKDAKRQLEKEGFTTAPLEIKT